LRARHHRLPDLSTPDTLCNGRPDPRPRTLDPAHLIEAGVDLLEVQQILGHRSILTTAKYTHLTCGTDHNATEAINALMNGFSIGWGEVE